MDTTRNGQTGEQADGIGLGRVIRAFVEGALVVFALGVALLVIVAPVAAIVHAVDLVASSVLGAHIDVTLWQNVVSVTTVVAIVVLAVVLVRVLVGLFRARVDLRGPLYQ
jgi:hypothetical protein